jgi:hypothetical protein
MDISVSNIYRLPTPGLPPFGLGGRPQTGALGRARDRAISTLVRHQWNKGLDRLNALRTSLGLKPVDDFWDQIRRSHKVLVLTSSAFDFPAELPDNTRYVGAVLDDPSWAAKQPWDPPAGGQPLVLVACRRLSRTRRSACSGSSTGWRRYQCAASSPPARLWTPQRFTAAATSSS